MDSPQQQRNADMTMPNTFLGGGEMGERIRAFDWAHTPLGTIETWPQSLKTTVRIMLTSRQPFWLGWGEQLIKLYNDPYKAIVGGKHPSALGQPAAVVWREIWEDIGPMLTTAMGGVEGTYVEAQLLIMERNGYPEETYYTFSYTPIPNDEGGVGGILCANTDDTQRVIGERQLALLRELAAKTVDARTVEDACALSVDCLVNNPYDLPFAMIYLVEPDARHVVLTGKGCGIERGHPAAPARAAIDSDAVWPFADVLATNRACLVSDLRAFANHLPMGAWDRPPQQVVVVPIAAQGPTGRVGTLVVGLNPYRLFDDPYRGFLELVAAQVAASIANAQAYEEERRRAEALAQLDRTKTAFFSNVSHEFRTPLTLMLSPLEDLQQSAEALLPEQREQLDVAHRNALRLLRLVNTLLDFSRIEAGRMQAAYEPTDLAVLTADLASVFRSTIERAGLRLVVTCPPLAERVSVDREMWEKIIFNLLSNAFKFTFAGEIDVTLRPVGALVELVVRDTGTGIPADEVPHLFERFHRVKGARGRTYEGSGIGLALVQELVKLHGGTVRVESELDRGSTFVVALPLGTAHLSTNGGSAARSLASTGLRGAAYIEEAQGWLHGGSSELAGLSSGLIPRSEGQSSELKTQNAARILLADDNADMRAYVGRLLSHEYDVIAVGDGAAALRAAQEHTPDLVLADVMMPELDGFGLITALRADERLKTVPVILLSARAGEEAHVEGMQAGADDYLVKPFSARELLAHVGAHLKMARIRAEAEKKLRGSEARQSLLLQLTQGQRETNDPHVMMADAAEAVGRYLGANRVGFFEMHDDDTLAFSVSWTDGVLGPLSGTFPASGIGTGYLAEVRAGRTLGIADTMHEQLTLDSLFGEIGARSIIGAPIIRNSRWRAGLYVNHATVRPWSDDEVALVRDVANQTWDAIERARARADLHESEARLHMLYGQEQAARAQAEEASRLKDEFLATVSHELRTPLTAFLGYAQMLQRRKYDAAFVDRTVGKLVRSAKSQAQLIEDLLDVSRIVSGKMRIEAQPIDLVPVILAALETVRPAVEAKELNLQLDLRPEASAIFGDPNRLQQVVWNLLANAAKFTPSGGTIQVRLEQHEHDAQLTVSDTGSGISAAFLPYVFDRFRQADSTSNRVHGGLGLGLSIVRHLVEQHGGTVQVASAGTNQGTTFTVRLPLVSDDKASFIEMTSAVSDELGGDDACPCELDGLRVLVVDDQPDILELLHDILTPCGAIVRMCNSARDALETARIWQPELLVSDIAMPDEDGYWLIRNLRRLAPNEGGAIPAIALTAYVRMEEHLQVLAAGFQLYVPKPVDPAELRNVVARLARTVATD